MKYHPILFSTPMVQAIDENRKRQTRRTKGLEKVNENPDEWKFDGIGTTASFPATKNDYKIFYSFINSKTREKLKIYCPYNVGDILWVRETFNSFDSKLVPFVYKATDFKSCGHSWKPSLFMPKKACRTFLKIKSIRVERLADISDTDAIAEGINSEPWALDNEVTLFENYTNYGAPFYSFSQYQWNFGKEEHSAAVASFCTLWEDINGEGSWNKNPFVWVYEFEKIEKPEDFV